MDVLTMLGFVILIGVVVNNAILIVHQALNNFHDNGMDYREAVLESTRSRLRADLYECHHQHLRHVATGADPRCRLGNLSRAWKCYPRRTGRLNGVYRFRYPGDSDLRHPHGKT